jgi:hypothetical protein
MVSVVQLLDMNHELLAEGARGRGWGLRNDPNFTVK